MNIIRLIKKLLYKQKMNRTDKVYFCKKFFDEMRLLAIKHWGNDINFIILNYNTESDILMKSLEEDGYTVINLAELTNEDILNNIEYHVSFNDPHPNGKAWDIIVNNMLNKI